jgi:hypothetical protein
MVGPGHPGQNHFGDFGVQGTLIGCAKSCIFFEMPSERRGEVPISSMRDALCRPE